MYPWRLRPWRNPLASNHWVRRQRFANPLASVMSPKTRWRITPFQKPAGVATRWRCTTFGVTVASGFEIPAGAVPVLLQVQRQRV